MGESVQFWGLMAGQRIREGPSLGWAWRLRAKRSGEGRTQSREPLAHRGKRGAMIFSSVEPRRQGRFRGRESKRNSAENQLLSHFIHFL